MVFEDFEFSPVGFLGGVIGAGVVAAMLKYTVGAGTQIPTWSLVLSPIAGFIGGYVVVATMMRD